MREAWRTPIGAIPQVETMGPLRWRRDTSKVGRPRSHFAGLGLVAVHYAHHRYSRCRKEINGCSSLPCSLRVIDAAATHVGNGAGLFREDTEAGTRRLKGEHRNSAPIWCSPRASSNAHGLPHVSWQEEVA
jgi:hypothetical protein